MVRATELGQLATEYLDDRKQEFQELEKSVKQDMKHRLNDLSFCGEQLEQLGNNMKHLIRRDVSLMKVYSILKDGKRFTTNQKVSKFWVKFSLKRSIINKCRTVALSKKSF